MRAAFDSLAQEEPRSSGLHCAIYISSDGMSIGISNNSLERAKQVLAEEIREQPFPGSCRVFIFDLADHATKKILRAQRRLLEDTCEPCLFSDVTFDQRERIFRIIGNLL
ncbi:MAG: hypothetical protein PHX93_00450 [Candidatus Peribacteraceae bacterium]|nr:hypothetical protein [Candidatus Peribacteraceae bacterium]